MHNVIGGKPKIVQKAFSILAVGALAIGGLVGLVSASAVYANNGLTVDAVPNSGTLTPGQTLEVDFHDPTGTTDAVADTCLVNGVETKDTFQNVSPGLYKVIYTVGASDTSRAAGQVPLSCTLHQQNSVTITAFDDGNTVAIDTTGGSTSGTGTGTTTSSGGDTGGTGTTTSSGGSTVSSNGTVSQNGGLTATAVPSSGTLSSGQSLDVQFGDPSGTTDAVADTCLVNGVETKDTFQNVSPGLYKVIYTVGASDTSRAAGQVPIDCMLHQAASVHVVTFTDGNTVAIDAAATSTGGSTGGTGTTTTSGGGTGSTSPLSLSSVIISPNSGTSTAGDLLHAFFQEGSGAADLSVAGLCRMNAVDVSNSLQNLGAGLYEISYTVGQNDGERPAGHTPIGCTLGDARGTVTASAWTDHNTLSIDTNGDSVIDNGTSTLGFTVTASPNTGTLHTGDTLHVAMQDPLPSGDVVITPSTGCHVNGADVASTYAYHGNGLYSVDYTVGASDTNRAAGQIPFDCRLQNATGSVHLTYFTDNNTAAVDASATTTSGGTTGGSTGSTTPGGMFSSVSIVPSTGSVTNGSQVEVLFTAANNVSNLVIGGACRVNDVEEGSTFQNLGGGQYRLTYTVGSSDAERAPGHLPINCAIRNPFGGYEIVKAFTDGNTLAVDTNGNGTITEPTGQGVDFMSTVMAEPNSGTLTAGQRLNVTMQEGYGDPSFAVGSCTVNGVDVANTFANLTDGMYRVTYTVGASDQSRDAGQVPVNCVLHNPEGQTISTIFGFTDQNTVAISAGGSTGGTGTTTNSGGNNGGTGTTTESVEITSVTAVPSTGTLHAGSQLEAHFFGTSNDITQSGACTVNGVDVSSTFRNVTDGQYIVTYTVGANDQSRAAGQVPVDCSFMHQGSALRATAFTDNDTVAIDTSVVSNGGTGTTTNSGGDNGGTGTTTNSGGDQTGGTVTGTTTPAISIASVTADPVSGTLHQGSHVLVYIREANAAQDLSLGSVCRVNNVNIPTLENLNNGLYRLDYTIGLNDQDRLAGTVPVNCALKNSAGATTTVSAFTDNNQVAIDAADDGIGSGTGGSVGGDVTGGSDALLSVTGIDPVSTTAVAGGGYDHGWVWVLHVTVPSNETSLSVKFSDWTHANGSSTIAAGGNMRISSPQAATADPVDITASGTYSAPLTLTGDIDPNTPGRQIEIRVEMKIPQSVLNGSYTTNYGIRTQ